MFGSRWICDCWCCWFNKFESFLCSQHIRFILTWISFKQNSISLPLIWFNVSIYFISSDDFQTQHDIIRNFISVFGLCFCAPLQQMTTTTTTRVRTKSLRQATKMLIDVIKRWKSGYTRQMLRSAPSVPFLLSVCYSFRLIARFNDCCADASLPLVVRLFLLIRKQFLCFSIDECRVSLCEFSVPNVCRLFIVLRLEYKWQIKLSDRVIYCV